MRFWLVYPTILSAPKAVKGLTIFLNYCRIRKYKYEMVFCEKITDVLFGNIFYINGPTSFAVALPLRCGSCKLIFLHYFIIYLLFKNVVPSLENGETLSYSASHQAPNYVQRSFILQNTLKRCVAVAVRLRLFFQFTYDQDCTCSVVNKCHCLYGDSSTWCTCKSVPFNP